MNQRFLPCSTTEFLALNLLIDRGEGYPTPDGRTLTYAEPLIHPTSAAWMMPIEERVEKYLSGEELESLLEFEQLQEAGWFTGAKEEQDA